MDAELTPGMRPGSRENVMSVYKRIRRMILSGKFQGGQVFSQVQLASEFETSRGPVREALRLLQKEGLIEAETNQQGRIVTFSASDLEQICSLLVLNVAMAIKAGAGRFTNRDIATVKRTIDRLEALANSHLSPELSVERRQLAFRRLILSLSKYSGPRIVQILEDLLDRLSMFRQLNHLAGVSPPYPLSDRFPDLRDACDRRDATTMAAIIVSKIAELSHEALTHVGDNYQPLLLDSYIQGARASLDEAATPAIDPAPEIQGAADVAGLTGMTIKIRGLPGGRFDCLITPQ